MLCFLHHWPLIVGCTKCNMVQILSPTFDKPILSFSLDDFLSLMPFPCLFFFCSVALLCLSPLASSFSLLLHCFVPVSFDSFHSSLSLPVSLFILHASHLFPFFFHSWPASFFFFRLSISLTTFVFSQLHFCLSLSVSLSAGGINRTPNKVLINLW